MPASKQSSRRKLAKLRAELHGTPWSIDVRALGMLTSAVETGDLEAVKATLCLGQDSCESVCRIVNGIAIIPVTGVLCDEVNFMVRWGYASSYQQLERDFAAAIDNSQIREIVFYCDTPGGSAIGCKRLADRIFVARGKKPIHAYVQNMCGSAGYYIASSCDNIVATADALVGSIGTIFPHMEMSGLLKALGYGATVFTNVDSPKKGYGNVYEPLSDSARKSLQQYVDSYGRPFIEDVARYRGITAEDVIAKYGQGDAIRADLAIKQGMVDALAIGFQPYLDSLSTAAGSGPSANSSHQVPPMIGTNSPRSSTMNERIKAQLFALGLIDSLNASDEVCKAALHAWHKARGVDVPSNDAQILASLQNSKQSKAEKDADGEEDDEEEMDCKSSKKAPTNVQQAHADEQREARIEDLTAAAELYNEAAGYEVVTLAMVMDAVEKKLAPKAASKEWSKVVAEKEPAIATNRIQVTGEGADRFANDVVDALVYKAAQSLSGKAKSVELSDAAASHVRKPMWAIAGECLQLAGNRGIDMYGDREYLAGLAMQMGQPGLRHTFFSPQEKRQYVQAAGTPVARPGDFPNILSGLANKFLDTIELDQDYSYGSVSAIVPGGLSDFKPELLINKGIVEELDEVQDAEAIKELGLSEEVLSYLFMRRFANKFGWTPIMIANDNLGAFVEGMIGLDEAWQVTQNRLVVERFTANETLLDGSALFANRTDTGAGSVPAANDNDVTSGSTPSDAQWAAMETKYADIGGVATGRRVRGTINVAFVPTGTCAQEARRTFLPLNTGGMEMKVANTTANVGLYRGEVQVVPESELRVSSTTKWYGLRNPTQLNTATVVRAYFNGFGEQGRRERWYDPETKTTWVSLEGRIAVAVKNWRYVIRNAGA